MGKIGIGTTSPTAKLEVVGSMSGRSLQIAGNQNVSGALLVLGNITNRGTFSGNYLHAEKGLSSSGGLVVEGTISGSLITQNGSGSNYFLGNVGIGTTSPDRPMTLYKASETNGNLARFHVVSDAKYPFIQITRERAGSANVQNGDYLGQMEFTPRFNGQIAQEVAAFGAIYRGDETTRRGDFYIATSNLDTAQPRLTVQYDGNVGIGTASPTYLLSLGGTAAR